MFSYLREIFFKGSYLRRLTISHLLVYGISLVLALYIGNISLSNLKNMVQHSIQTQASYLLADLDSHVNEIRHLADGITANQAVLDILYDDQRAHEPSSLDILHVRSNLNIYSRPYLTDIALYFPESRRVISNRYTALRSEDYIQTYYSNSNDSMVIRNGLESNRYMTFGGLGSPFQLAVFVSVPRSFSARSMGTAMFVIDPSIFNGITEFADTYGASFSLFSDTDSLLLAHGPQPQENSFTLEEHGTSGLKIVFDLPNNYFKDETRSLQLQLSILLVVTTILGALVSWLLSRHAYRPVQKLTSLALDEGQHVDQVRTDELELIRHGLTRNRTREEIEEDAEEARFIHRLINDGYSQLDPSMYHLRGSHAKALSSAGVLVRLDLVRTYSENLADLLDTQPVNLLHTIVSNVLNELFHNRYECLYNQDRPGSFTILIIPSEKDDGVEDQELILADTGYSIETMREDTKKSLHQFQAFTQSKLNLNFHVAYAMLPSIRKSAHDANEKLNDALLQANVDSDKLVLTPGDVPLELAPYNYSHEVIENLSRTSIQENKPVPTEVFRDIYARVFEGQKPHGSQLHHLKLDLINMAQSIISLYETESDLLYILKEATTLKQIERAYTALLEDLRQHYLETFHDKQQSKQVADLCNKVDHFILENYSDPSLSLHSFEEPFNLTSSYLSSIYKGYRGYSINDRITDIRIDKGKELLLTTDHNVNEIAQECGYLYSTVFIRAFKRKENTTPAAYRRLHQGSK